MKPVAKLLSKRGSGQENDEEKRLKFRKLEEQTRALELDNYKRHLEILDLERKLDLPQSELIGEFINKYTF